MCRRALLYWLLNMPHYVIPVFYSGVKTGYGYYINHASLQYTLVYNIVALFQGVGCVRLKVDRCAFVMTGFYFIGGQRLMRDPQGVFHKWWRIYVWDRKYCIEAPLCNSYCAHSEEEVSQLTNKLIYSFIIFIFY